MNYEINLKKYEWKKYQLAENQIFLQRISKLQKIFKCVWISYRQVKDKQKIKKVFFNY